MGTVRRTVRTFFPALLLAATLAAQNGTPSLPGTQAQPGAPSSHPSNGIVKGLLNYIRLSPRDQSQYRAPTERERAALYGKALISPFLVVNAAVSGARAQWQDSPAEWGQGWGAYGQRMADRAGRYGVRRTLLYVGEVALREDTRYFGSGKKGFWPRIGYAMRSSVSARTRDGHQRISASQLGSLSGAAFISRLWLPRSNNSAGDAAVSFGSSVGMQMGFSIFKEFVPDLVRVFDHKAP
jgi:hypothetical protein